MKFQECQAQPLAAYVDGELSGMERLQVTRHLEACPSCFEDADEMRRVGELLRTVAALEPLPTGLEGLAGGVVSRTSAERAQSWRALLARGVEDWHWFLVGFGSVTAAFASIAFVSAVLQFGPRPEREDSVSRLLSNRDWQVNSQLGGGSLYTWATPVRDAQWRIMLTARERAAAADAASHPIDSLAGLTTEGDFVGALGETLTHSGEPINVQAMDAGVRRHAEALLTRLTMLKEPQRDASGGSVYRMQLVTNTEVTPKGSS